METRGAADRRGRARGEARPTHRGDVSGERVHRESSLRQTRTRGAEWLRERRRSSEKARASDGHTQNLESLWKWRSPESEKREWARFLFRVPSLAKPYLYGWFGLFLPDEDCRINRNSLTELTCIKRHEFLRVQNKKSPVACLGVVLQVCKFAENP